VAAIDKALVLDVLRPHMAMRGTCKTCHLWHPLGDDLG
jgi:hypothetical protein